MGVLNDLIQNTTINSHIDPSNPKSSGAGSGFWSGINTDNGLLDPQVVIFNVSVIILWALGIAAVITFIIAGVKYITAGGDAEKAESAKKIIIGSIIGLLIIISSYLIFNTAVSVLNSPPNQSADQILNKTYP